VSIANIQWGKGGGGGQGTSRDREVGDKIRGWGADNNGREREKEIKAGGGGTQGGELRDKGDDNERNLLRKMDLGTVPDLEAQNGYGKGRDIGTSEARGVAGAYKIL